MHRRRFLSMGGVALTAGSGCLSLGGSARTEPLSGSFDPVPEGSYWQLSVETDTALDSHPNLAKHGDIYVAPGSRLLRISPDGTVQWNVETRIAPRDLEATDSGIYYSGGGNEVAPVLAAHAPATGAERWWHELEYHPSLVDATNDAVFLGATTDDPTDEGMPVTSFAADAGEQRWRKEAGITLNGRLTHDLCLVESYPATLIAFASGSGDEQWRHTFEDEINGIRVVGDTLVLLSKAGVTAYTLPSGDLRWEKSNGDPEWLATDGDGSESPETVYVGGRDGTLRAIDLSSGEIQWSKSPTAENDKTRVIGVAHGHNRLVARKGDTLLGLNAADGRETWRQLLSPLYQVSAPVVIGEAVLLLHSPEGDEIQVRTFDSTSGERLWRHSSGLTDNLLPRYSVVEDRFIMATQSGDVFGFGITGG